MPFQISGERQGGLTANRLRLPDADDATAVTRKMTPLPSGRRVIVQPVAGVTRAGTIDTPASRPTIGTSRNFTTEIPRRRLRFEVLDDPIHKADVLIEAMGWIRRFRDRLVVIKLGGSALEDPETVSHLLTDVIFMETVGIKLVLIHGGGKAINAAMKTSQLVPRFVQGRRYTDLATLDIVARVLAGEICADLVKQIRERGGQAIGFSYLTQNVLTAQKLMLHGDHGEPLDLGYVGEVVAIDRELLLKTCRSGAIPVIPSIALDENGQKYNVNADTAAAAVARILDAEKLIFLSDVSGIYRDRTNPETLVSHLTEGQCRELIADGTIDSGMVPKVEAALDALKAGVKKVHIVDGRMPHSLLVEIFSDKGIGTEIVP